MNSENYFRYLHKSVHNPRPKEWGNLQSEANNDLMVFRFLIAGHAVIRHHLDSENIHVRTCSFRNYWI